MKAQTLAVCLPGTACDKKCPYCVSKMTWNPPINEDVWLHNISKAVFFAQMAQVTDVIITGKGEPFINDYLCRALSAFRQWPLIVQTNGKRLAGNPEFLKHILSAVEFGHINVLSVSIDNPEQVESYKALWNSMGDILTARITVMLTPEVCKMSFEEWVKICALYKIRGLTFREVTIPTECTLEGEETKQWIQTNIATNSQIAEWKHHFDSSFDLGPILRRLPYGAIIRDFDGVSVTKFEYCIQDSSGEDDIRSLIYNQDGHLYTSWNSPASMIF